jgi:hypothetical protein
MQRGGKPRRWSPGGLSHTTPSRERPPAGRTPGAAPCAEGTASPGGIAGLGRHAITSGERERAGEGARRRSAAADSRTSCRRLHRCRRPREERGSETEWRVERERRRDILGSIENLKQEPSIYSFP